MPGNGQIPPKQMPTSRQAACMAPAIQSLRARLERWELDHLRALAADLNGRLERLEERAKRAEDEATRAWESAEFWQRHAENLQQELWQAGGEIGLTQDGQLVARGQAEEA